MKTNQKLKSAFYAMCFTIALLFCFKTSNAQYARIEAANPVSYQGPSFDPMYVSQDYLQLDYYVRFYSDAACTIPATVGAGLTVDYFYVVYRDEVLQYDHTEHLTNTTTTGVTELYLGTDYEHNLYIDNYGTAWGTYATMGSTSFAGIGAGSITYLGVH
jgi:hypothetical protein